MFGEFEVHVREVVKTIPHAQDPLGGLSERPYVCTDKSWGGGTQALSGTPFEMVKHEEAA